MITFLMLCSCDMINGYRKIGEAKVFYSEGELLVDNFPQYTIGAAGIGILSFGSFSFEELDEYVYRTARSASTEKVYISIRTNYEDTYGNAVKGKTITIGYIDVGDTKKYTDFDHWHEHNRILDMWEKDYYEYERRTNQEAEGKLYYSTKAYQPISIR